ncbi:MAG: 1-acyl-sn-glycerol-3-phosphate acyltransferase [Gloeobacteraceae cyanobacterium ES-bin-144]|nr:1-acyl-sn-glycerol-3-phosphate acyltransferase [Verrucomicrobiales bacterium]
MTQDFIALVTRIVTGVRQITDPVTSGPPRIYFANHSSHLDFVVIWAALPKYLRNRARPVAAADYWERGRIRSWLAHKVFNAVLIPRGKVTRDDDPIGKMAAAMDQGADLILFPEGTRSSDGKVAEFKPGIHSLVKKYPCAELIPVHLSNLNHILPKGEFLIVPIIGSAIFGPTCEGLKEGETRHDFLVRTRASLLALSTHSECQTS